MYVYFDGLFLGWFRFIVIFITFRNISLCTFAIFKFEYIKHFFQKSNMMHHFYCTIWRITISNHYPDKLNICIIHKKHFPRTKCRNNNPPLFITNGKKVVSDTNAWRYETQKGQSMFILTDPLQVTGEFETIKTANFPSPATQLRGRTQKKNDDKKKREEKQIIASPGGLNCIQTGRPSSGVETEKKTNKKIIKL